MIDKDKPDNSFRDAVKGIKRMANKKVTLKPPMQKRLMQQRIDDCEESSIPNVCSDELLFYKSKGLPAQLISQLKKGKLAPEETIDLHGMNAIEASQYLDEFLNECIAHESFCVCIIHGKGRNKSDNPILKNMVNRRLKEDFRVLAFASAPRALGGAGAVLLLLR